MSFQMELKKMELSMRKEFNSNQIQWLKQLGVDGLWGQNFNVKVHHEAQPKVQIESKVPNSQVFASQISAGLPVGQISVKRLGIASKESQNFNSQSFQDEVESVPEVVSSTEKHAIDSIKSLDELYFWYIKTYRDWGYAEDEHDLIKTVPKDLTNVKLMVFEESPSMEDILVSTQFVGKPGTLLKNMLSQLSLSLDEIYTTSVYKTDMTAPDEESRDLLVIEAFKKEIELVDPQVIWCFDRSVLFKFLNNKKITIDQVRFNLSLNNKYYPIICSLNPRILISNPVQKKDAWRGLNLIAQELQNNHL